jgi:hypothetical protein
MTDLSYQYAKRTADSTHPVVRGRAVVLSDTTILPMFRALWVGVGGSVSIIEADGTTATAYAGVPNGYLLPVQGVGVRTTGTSASSIVALY